MYTPPEQVEEMPDAGVELSVVIPCLNEADTLEVCIRKAQRALREHRICGEIIVADNGSRDASPEIARRMGARLIEVSARGYGNALMGGIAAARGRYVVMGDGDDSYDFLEIPRFVEKLREGFEMVQGCRLPRGGGQVLPEAMPFLHRWLGNPLFSLLARWWFRAPIHDVYCGLRGFTKDLYRRLDQRCTGMEFATEMIIKASLHGARIAEVPVTLHRDGRQSHAPHLRTFRDGWRTLRFFMMYSPRWLFLYPGAILMLVGLVAGTWLLGGPVVIESVGFDAQTLLYAAVAVIIGFQAIAFAIFTKTFAVSEGLHPADPLLSWLLRHVTLEAGVLTGGLLMLAGLLGSLYAVGTWQAASFGALDMSRTLRIIIPSVTALTLGSQTLLASFFLSILRLKRR